MRCGTPYLKSESTTEAHGEHVQIASSTGVPHHLHCARRRIIELWWRLWPDRWPQAEREQLEKLESQTMSPLEARSVEARGGLVSATASPIGAYAGARPSDTVETRPTRR